MRTKIKKHLVIISLLVSISLTLPSVTAFAALDEVTTEEAALKLHTLGLLNGDGVSTNGLPDFALDRAATGIEAVVMAIKLAGKETDARRSVWAAYAPGAPDWAKSYLGFAYAKGLVVNTGDPVYETGGNATAFEFVFTILRAFQLVSETGFVWEEMLALANYINNGNGNNNGNGTGAAVFTRGDMIAISYSAMGARHRGTGATLCSWLVSAGVITESSAIAAGLLNESDYSRDQTAIEDLRVPEAAAPDPASTQNTAHFENTLFDLINAERAKHGLRILDRSPVIASVALAHSKDMAGRGFFNHVNPDGLNPSARLRAAGLSFARSGEVLARGYRSPEAALAAWMNSPSHRDTILNAGLSYMGVGLYELFWTVDFTG